jgi:4a-hydroxytetrahydrobiopterin dehydratase
MTALRSDRCVPCEGGVPPLSDGGVQEGLRELGDEWTLDSKGHLRRAWTFPDFRQALAFTNRVGELAEVENHHPEIELGWGKVAVAIWTHAIDGLSRNDFILAAKLSELPLEA